MEGPGEEEGENGEQVLAGAKMRATGRELMRMAASTARGGGGEGCCTGKEAFQEW